MAKGEGSPLEFSQRFTVDHVTPTLAANCSCVRPSLALNCLIIAAPEFPFFLGIQLFLELAML